MKGLALRTQFGVFMSLVTMAMAFLALVFFSKMILSASLAPAFGVVVTALLGGVLFVVAFKVAELIAPPPPAPENLQIGGMTLSFKEIWKSKTFWLAIGMLAVQIFNLAAGSEILDQSFVDQIAALDWSDWLQAVFALGMIVVRKFFTGSGIK